jgi:DNA repair exonuclease SbcCD ATPase subunit
MITIKHLKWSNCFSYGLNNNLDFTRAPLTQLVGKNGHGKSSIALILEEVLYNKNSKGIKKADILNRYVKDNWYSIELVLAKDNDEYKIETKRSGSQVVKLYKNGKDVSGHTATTTYKIIEDIIGIDHKTFTQVVYQSGANSLEFLTSADTARKKFLIELLNLTKYTETGEQFKRLYQEVAVLVASAETKLRTIQDWIDKYNRQNLDLKSLLPVPNQPEQEVQQAASIRETISTISAKNKKISQNNTYKTVQGKLKVLPVPEKPAENVAEYIAKRAEYDKAVQDANQFIRKLTSLSDSCPTCLQAINRDKTQELLSEYQQIVTSNKELSKQITEKIQDVEQRLKLWKDAIDAQTEWEKYYQLIDTELPTELFDEKVLQKQLDELQKCIQQAKTAIQTIELENQARQQHNSKVELLKSQLADMQEDLTTWQTNLEGLQNRLNILGVLVKTFSTTGLVAYKIENLVKDLEVLTNQYLGELSGGRFQLAFEISGNDKLNVVIVDNANSIDIQALSGGERARVNVATLLAIRKLMQSLSQNRVNLLILDETVEALDLDGKEKLVEILLREENLNTLLVSHGFTHPLLEKITVVKKQNISRIED